MKKITTDRSVAKFVDDIAKRPGAENIRKCFSCGTCTGGCPVFQVESGYNPRKIIRMILLGLREEVLCSKMIWLCARCYACTANCPQNVSFADIMTVLRDMVIEAGYASSEMMHKIETLNLAMNELRKDGINLVTGAGDSTKEKIEQKIKSCLEQL